jgi:hypothetical protein
MFCVETLIGNSIFDPVKYKKNVDNRNTILFITTVLEERYTRVRTARENISMTRAEKVDESVPPNEQQRVSVVVRGLQMQNLQTVVPQ